MNNRVSVVIVTHNRKNRLELCIKSILNNSIKPYEVVIVDDSDYGKDCKDLISFFKKNFSVTSKFIYKRIYPKRGVSYSRNKGVKNSSGEIIAFIDDDCDADVDWIKNIKTSHRKHKISAAITGMVFPKYPQNYWNRVLYKFHENSSQKATKASFLFGANYSVKTYIFKDYKLYFNENMPFCSEDNYLTHVLNRERFSLIYDPSIKVWHDFRKRIFQVIKQWLRYGVSDYYYWLYTPSYKSSDSEFFSKSRILSITLKLPLLIYKRSKSIIHDLKIRPNQKDLIPGLFLIYFFYYLGVYSGKVKKYYF